MNKFGDIRTGVIGVGSMGQNHARIYNDISNLVAVSDSDEEQGRKIANKFDIKWYKDYREMLNQVEAVTIAVPTKIHRKIAEDVVSSGVNILVEKPLAGSVADAEAIIAAADSANVKLAVGHVERHNPVVSYAKKAIKNGDWGEIITLSSRRVSSFPARIHDVGVLFDLSIHDIDISAYLADSEVISVYAAGGCMKASHEDHVNLILKHDSGLISICETNWLTPMKIRKMGITTSTHYIELDYQNQTIQLFKSKFINVDEINLYNTNLEFQSKEISIDKNEPLLLELLDFLTAIKSDSQPLVTGYDGLNVVRISEVALVSLKNKKVINLK